MTYCLTGVKLHLANNKNKRKFANRNFQRNAIAFDLSLERTDQ